jgi:hypothetical protein
MMSSELVEQAILRWRKELWEIGGSFGRWCGVFVFDNGSETPTTEARKLTHYGHFGEHL